MKPTKTVDDYLAGIPEAARITLEKVRQRIRAAVPPGSTEGTSYGMPAFKHEGKALVVYAAFQNHCSLFPMSGKVIATLEDELKSYRTSKGTIQFPLGKPLPAALIKKVVKTHRRTSCQKKSAAESARRPRRVILRRREPSGPPLRRCRVGTKEQPLKTSRITQALAAAALAAAMLCPSLSAQERIEVPWRDLARALDGRAVSTVLADGTVLRGRVIEASTDELRFEVKKTSNRELYSKGERSVPRSQLAALSYTERRGRWRALGTAIGGGSGAVGAVFVCVAFRCGENYQNSDTGAVIAAAVVGAGAAIGYGVGHAADTRTVTVFVAKDLE